MELNAVFSCRQSFNLFLQERDYRVIVVNTYPPTARRLLCQAYHLQRMHYPRYVWILPGWFEENWWREGENTNKSDKVICTQEEMKVMLKNSLGITEAPSDYLGQNKLASLVSLFVKFMRQHLLFCCSVDSLSVLLMHRTLQPWYLKIAPHLQQSVHLLQQSLLCLHMTLFCYWHQHSACKMHPTINN